MGNTQSVNEIHFSGSKNYKQDFAPTTIVYESSHRPIVHTESLHRPIEHTESTHRPIVRQPSYAQPENRVLPFGVSDINNVKLRPTGRSVPDVTAVKQNGGSRRSSQHSGGSSHGSHNSRRPLSTMDAKTFNKIYDAHEDKGLKTANSIGHLNNANNSNVFRSPSSASTPQKLHNANKQRAPAPPTASRSVPATPVNGHKKPMRKLSKKQAPAPPLATAHERLYRKNSQNLQSDTSSLKRNRKNRKAPLPPVQLNENDSIQPSVTRQDSKSNWEVAANGSIVCRIEPSVRPPVEPPVDYHLPPADEHPPIREIDSPARSMTGFNSGTEITLKAVIHNSQDAEPQVGLTKDTAQKKPDIDSALKKLRQAISNISASTSGTSNGVAPSASPPSTEQDEVKLTRQASTKSESVESETSNEDSGKNVMHRMSSLLQHDIVRAAQSRPLKPIAIKQDFDRPKTLQQLFEDELSMAYGDREKRRSSGNLRKTPSQDQLVFSAKLGRVVSKTELRSLREHCDDEVNKDNEMPCENKMAAADLEDEQEAKIEFEKRFSVDAEDARLIEDETHQYPGAKGLVSLFSDATYRPVEPSPRVVEEEEEALNSAFGKQSYKLNSSGSYKKKKIDKGKFNSIKRIKKSVQNAIGSLGRASARLQLKIHSEQKPDPPSMLETDTNWSLAPTVSKRKDMNADDGLSWGLVDINVDENIDYEGVVNNTSDDEDKDVRPIVSRHPKKEYEEGIACYDNKGKVVVIPQCEVVKIVRRRSCNASENEADEKDVVEETKTFIYQPVKIGENKMDESPERPVSSRRSSVAKPAGSGRSSISSTGQKANLSEDLKGNYVLVPRDQLEKLMKADAQESKKKKKGTYDSDEDISPPPSLKKLTRSEAESDDNSSKTTRKKKGKKSRSDEKPKKGKKKYVYVDESDDSEEEVIEIRKGKQKKMVPPQPPGFYGSQNIYQQPPYHMMHGFNPAMMTDYARQMQMASFQGNMSGYPMNIGYPGNNVYPGNMVNGYGNMPMNGYMNQAYQQDNIPVQQPQTTIPSSVKRQVSSESDNQDSGFPVTSSPSTSNDRVMKSPSSSTVESVMSADQIQLDKAKAEEINESSDTGKVLSRINDEPTKLSEQLSETSFNAPVVNGENVAETEVVAVETNLSPKAEEEHVVTCPEVAPKPKLNRQSSFTALVTPRGFRSVQPKLPLTNIENSLTAL